MSEQQLWDELYEDRRLYRDATPMPFVVDDVATAIRMLPAAQHAEGATCLDIGIGNGRNLPALADVGLSKIVGLDISAVALDQLRDKLQPNTYPPVELIHGDVSQLPPDSQFDVVLAIHVFQHGERDAAHDGIAAAKKHIAPGGLLALCVEAAVLDAERSGDTRLYDDGSYTCYYNDERRPIHAFSQTEIQGLTEGLEPVLTPRYIETRAFLPAIGVAARWEAIWRRPDGR